MVTQSGRALLVVDMQRTFLETTGVIARLRGSLPGSADLLSRTERLVSQARSRGMPVIYTRHGYRPDYADADLLMRRDERARENGALIAGSPDAAIMPQLNPDDGVIIDKNRYDAFRDTTLEAELRRQGAVELLIAGVLTNVCVEANVRAAYDRDYDVVVLADCTAARTEALHRNSIGGLVQSKLARAMNWHDALFGAN